MTLLLPAGSATRTRPSFGRFQSMTLQPYERESFSNSILASADKGGEWESHICFEGMPTGDGREIAPGALKMRPGPTLPMMGLDQRTMGHMLSRVCGAMGDAERRDDGTIYAGGHFAATELGQYFEGLASFDANGVQMMNRVSVDLEVRAMEQVLIGYDDDGYEEYLMRITDANLMGLCYSSDTEVLTDHGWKRFDQIERGVDRMATRNQKTGAFEWQEPTAYTDNLWNSAVNGKMIQFSNRGVDLLVTPNHRMLVQTRKGTEAFIPAEKLMALPKGAYGIPLVSTWEGTDVATFRIEGPEPVAEGLCLCGCGAETRTRTGWEGGGRPPGQLKALPGHGHGKSTKPLVLNGDDFAMFMGAYLAEGCVDSKRGRVSIAQKPESRGFEMYRDLVTRMLGRPAYHDGKCFVFKNRRLVDYLAQFGHAPAKYIPAELKDFSARQLRLFWDAYMAGDGDAAGDRAYTTSKRLADDLQEVGQKIGLWVTIPAPVMRKKDQTMPDGRVIEAKNALPYYVLGIHNIHQGGGKGTGSVASWNWKTTEENYVGTIHCVTVPNESLYVRRNGKAAWCGNTIVPFPAFSRAVLAPKGSIDKVASLALADRELGGRPWTVQSGPVAVAASAERSAEHPPAEWFSDPGFDRLTHVRVDAAVNGWRRFSGHLADWKVPHIGIGGTTYAPRCTGRVFTSKPFTVATPEGTQDIKVGVLTVGGGHAPLFKPDGTHYGWKLASAHYDDPRYQGAVVVYGEDSFGPWIAGAVAEEASELQVKILSHSDVSGDWRSIGGEMELVGIAAVNTGGFPVVEEAAAFTSLDVDFRAAFALTASSEDHGEMVALVAAGMIRQDPTLTELQSLKREVHELKSALEPFRGLGMEWLARQMSQATLEASLAQTLAAKA